MQRVELLSLGSVPYRECWQLQRRHAALCRETGVGTVIFVEHPPVVTLGRAGRRSGLVVSEAELAAAGVDLVHSDRGGDVTYHGPGQLVVYPILNLGLWSKDVHRYLRALEEATLRTLADFGIQGHRSPLGTGVWARHPEAGSAKIASLGVHLSRWITSHGLALNVCNSLEPFSRIVPCGLSGVTMTSISSLLGRCVNRAAAEERIWTHLAAQFDLVPVESMESGRAGERESADEAPATMLTQSQRRLPDWLKVRIPGGEQYNRLKSLMRGLNLHTVCEDAGCPNIGECWGRGVATFMILGNVCTRACGYCAVQSGKPFALDPQEPLNVAQAVRTLGLKHIVVTSVDRDDLKDGGASVFASTVEQIRRLAPGCTVELLVPDFRGDEAALRAVVNAGPEILNHNVETVPRLYRLARSGGNYRRSIALLEKARRWRPEMITKTGMMLGLGEEKEEVLCVMRDLVTAGVRILTLGQYLQPTRSHLPVSRFYHPDEFREMRVAGERLGLSHVEAGPLVRSSYQADRQFEQTLRPQH